MTRYERHFHLIACHEAGHVIMALVHGESVTEAYIRGDGGDQSKGCVTRSDSPYDRALIAIAGIAAEAIAALPPRKRSKLEKPSLSESWLNCGLYVDEDGAGSDIIQVKDWLAGNLSEPAHLYVLHGLWLYVCTTLYQHWEQVETIAGLLKERRTIDQAQIEQALRPWPKKLENSRAA